MLNVAQGVSARQDDITPTPVYDRCFWNDDRRFLLARLSEGRDGDFERARATLKYVSNFPPLICGLTYPSTPIFAHDVAAKYNFGIRLR